jgi:hypothetical protein
MSYGYVQVRVPGVYGDTSPGNDFSLINEVVVL